MRTYEYDILFVAYMSFLMVSSIVSTYLFASRFQLLDFNLIIKASCSFFFISAIIAFIYLLKRPYHWNPAFLGSLLSLLTSSLLCTVVYHEIIIFFLPVLFLPAGTALGGAIAVELAQ